MNWRVFMGGGDAPKSDPRVNCEWEIEVDQIGDFYVARVKGNQDLQANGHTPNEAIARLKSKLFNRTPPKSEPEPDRSKRPSDRVGLDGNAQPSPAFNAARRAARSHDEIIGFVKGILADGRVVPEEVKMLGGWLCANAQHSWEWPMDDLARRLNKILEDGMVSEEECEDLQAFLIRMTGDPRSAPTENTSTRLPLTDPAPTPLLFEGRRFVFTGAFAYGVRRECEQAVIDRGGECSSNVSGRTNVLVIGDIGSRDWIHTTHGRKIEAAVEFARAGKPLHIVCEQHWRRFIA